MRLPSWLRRKAPEREIVVTAQIVVNKTIPRTDLPEFCADAKGGVVDMRPFAAEVLAHCPEEVTVDAETLARLAAKGYNGKYIKVAEYPAGMDRETVKMLIRRVRRRADWPHERAGMERSIRAFPARQIYCNPNTACAGALALRDRIIPVEDVRRLPLDDCWSRHCQCYYRLVDRHGNAV